jgi:hypothetical protein
MRRPSNSVRDVDCLTEGLPIKNMTAAAKGTADIRAIPDTAPFLNILCIKAAGAAE